jgi:hypothetical protein
MGATPGDFPDDIGRRLEKIAAELAAEAKSGEPDRADRTPAPVAGSAEPQAPWGPRQPAEPGRQQPAEPDRPRQPAEPGRQWAGIGIPGATTGERALVPRKGPWRRARDKRIAAQLRKPVQSSSSTALAARPRASPAIPAKASPVLAKANMSRSPAVASRQPGAGRRRATAAVLVPVLALAALVGVSYGLYRLHSESAGGSAPSRPGALPTEQPTTVLPAFSATDPFAGSPAESFADGSDGITWPSPAAIGQFSSGQVSAAYQVVRQLLIAANLNQATLNGAAPTAFAALLLPQQRAWFDQHLDHIGLTKTGKERSTRGWVTSFAPGSTALVGHVIKVQGSMSASSARFDSQAALQVRTDYLFVYPVQQPGQPTTRMRVVVRYIATVDFAHWTNKGGPLQPWIISQDGGVAGIQCGINDGFVHPSYPGQRGSVQPSGRAYDPYNQQQRWPSTACSPTTGT